MDRFLRVSVTQNVFFPGQFQVFQELVLATVQDLSKLTSSTLSDPGYYLVGTGDTGVASAIAVLGAVYFGIMTLSAMTIRWDVPATVVNAVVNDAAAVGVGVAAAIVTANCCFFGVYSLRVSSTDS